LLRGAIQYKSSEQKIRKLRRPRSSFLTIIVMEEHYRNLSLKTDGVHTHTSLEQLECERTCLFNMLPLHLEEMSPEEREEFEEIGLLNDAGEVMLMREKHLSYLRWGLEPLPGGFVALDASRPWIIYWILHGMDLLGGLDDDEELKSRARATLAACQYSKGGFGGGPLQLPHTAPTYASTMALLLMGGVEAYSIIDRVGMHSFLLGLKHPSGGFRMHDDGEVDVRGTYTAVAVASLLDILTPAIIQGVAEYCLSAQTYEGGFGGEPWNEAHGGYAYCAFATLCILGREGEVDLDALESWLCARQMRFEGGFQGRTNKLVDGCYSFWQGGAGALVELTRRNALSRATHREGVAGGSRIVHLGQPGRVEKRSSSTGVVASATSQSGQLAFSQRDLQRYVLLCAQQPDGGLRDKPGKPRDFYHSCYNLSGLSVAQHWLGGPPGDVGSDEVIPVVLGCSENLLRSTNPVYNIVEDKAIEALRYFQEQERIVDRQ
jgi:protein farnesyltransferase subunit beta